MEVHLHQVKALILHQIAVAALAVVEAAVTLQVLEVTVNLSKNHQVRRKRLKLSLRILLETELVGILFLT